MATYETNGSLTTAIKTADEEAVEITTNATIPTGTSISLSVKQDESGGTTADSTETVSVSDGVQSNSLSSFSNVNGASYWITVDLSTTDSSVTPSFDEAVLTIGDDLEWSTDTDWDNAESEQRVVHGLLPNTDTHDASDLKQGYQYGSLTRGLVGYWKFDDDSDTTTAVDSALDNDGTINGASYCSGKINHGLDFDSGDSVDTTYDGNLGTGPLTITAWINWDSFSNSNNTTWISTYDGNNGIILGLRYDTEWRVWLSGDEVTGGVANTGSWYHHVGVRAPNGDMKLFINGSLTATAASTGNVDTENTVRIGKRPSGNGPIDGQLDEVRIYDRSLSHPEIKALYTLTEPSVVTEEDTL